MSKQTEAVAQAVQKLKYAENGTVIVVSLVNEVEGKDDEVVRSFTFNAAEFPAQYKTGDEAVTKTLAAYGLKKLLQDRTSQVSSSVEDKFEAMLEEGMRLHDTDEWRSEVVRASGGSTPKADPILAQAVAQLQGISVAVATASLSKLSKDEVAQIKANASVVALMDSIRAEMKTAAAGGTDLLASLMAN